MKKHVFIFLGTFVTGALVAFGARAALHEPHADSAASPEPAAAAQVASAPVAADHGASHGSHETAPAAPVANPAPAPAADAPVNTVCAICGMKVNPKIPTETYQGKKVGFGCAGCPATFRANPDKYGPAALRNEVVED